MDKSLFSKDYDAFLSILRNTRERAGLTQAQLAELLGQTQSFVSKCERGERRLDLVEVRHFCLALGTTLPALSARVERELKSPPNAG